MEREGDIVTLLHFHFFSRSGSCPHFFRPSVWVWNCLPSQYNFYEFRRSPHTHICQNQHALFSFVLTKTSPEHIYDYVDTIGPNVRGLGKKRPLTQAMQLQKSVDIAVE
eukprot:scaffold2428_cov97-Cylindrotheca_fusiformis.AAC.8